MKTLTITVLILFLAVSGAVADPAVAKVTVQVMDENGSPLTGADARITFEQPVHQPGQWGSASVKNHSGKAAVNGSFSAEDKSSNHVTFGAAANGYYPSSGFLDFALAKDEKWQPWDSTVPLKLKRIIRPTPMYARR